jgi:hypothetical protein
MEIPCSVLKPVVKSCRLYNGGHIASKPGIRYALYYILCTMCFCPTTSAISSFLQRFICIHLLATYLTLMSLFSNRSPHRLYSFCSVEWFGDPACTTSPILPREKHDSRLYHLQYSMLKNFSKFRNFTAQAKSQSRKRDGLITIL